MIKKEYRNEIKKPQLYFLLALLGHLFLFTSFSFVYISDTDPVIYQPYDASLPKKPFTVLPAYISHEPVKTSLVQPQVAKLEKETPKNEISKKIATEKPKQQMTKTTLNMKQTSSVGFAAQMQTESSTADKTDDEPLLKLLYKATAEHLIYPRMDPAFKVTGTVQIRFLVSPSGELSQIKLIKSSGFGPFDDAAINAINAMSPVPGVNFYLKNSKFVTANIIFR